MVTTAPPLTLNRVHRCCCWLACAPVGGDLMMSNDDNSNGDGNGNVPSAKAPRLEVLTKPQSASGARGALAETGTPPPRRCT